MGGAVFSQPWRDLPEKDENHKFVKHYQPKKEGVKQLRILLHGPVGAGKSSFINSVESALRGQVFGRALTDSISGTSFTKKYTAYEINGDQEGLYPLVFTDIMGFEQSTNSGVRVEDVTLAMKGHVEKDYQFNPQQHLTETNRYYNPSPTLADRVHVLVSVVPAAMVSFLSEGVVRKMREVRLAASDLGIPQLAILTKVDEACPEVKNNIKNVYKSKYLKKQVDEFSQLLGLPPNCIFLVKNYESEIKTIEEIDKLILVALRQMISLGEASLNN